MRASRTRSARCRRAVLATGATASVLAMAPSAARRRLLRRAAVHLLAPAACGCPGIPAAGICCGLHRTLRAHDSCSVERRTRATGRARRRRPTMPADDRAGALFRLLLLPSFFARFELANEVGRLGVLREQRLDFLEVLDRGRVLVGPVVLEAAASTPCSCRSASGSTFASLTSSCSVADATRKLKPWTSLSLPNVARPTTLPCMSIAGPPELPCVIGALIWRICSPLVACLSDEIAPSVTVACELRLLVEQDLHVGDARIADHDDLILDLRPWSSRRSAASARSRSSP